MIIIITTDITTWGYTTTDNNGEAVEHWAEANNLTLIHDAKLPKSFNSKLWKSGYNPDFFFASITIGESTWIFFLLTVGIILSDVHLLDIHVWCHWLSI